MFNTSTTTQIPLLLEYYFCCQRQALRSVSYGLFKQYYILVYNDRILYSVFRDPRTGGAHQPWLATRLAEDLCHRPSLLGHGAEPLVGASLRALHFTSNLLSAGGRTCPRLTNSHFESSAAIGKWRMWQVEDVTGRRSLDSACRRLKTRRLIADPETTTPLGSILSD